MTDEQIAFTAFYEKEIDPLVKEAQRKLKARYPNAEYLFMMGSPDKANARFPCVVDYHAAESDVINKMIDTIEDDPLWQGLPTIN